MQASGAGNFSERALIFAHFFERSELWAKISALVENFPAPDAGDLLPLFLRILP